MTTKHTPGQRCDFQVWTDAWHPHTCGRPIFEDGKCKIHCASAVEARRKKSQEKWDKKMEAHAAPFRRLAEAESARDRLLAENAALREALDSLQACASSVVDAHGETIKNSLRIDLWASINNGRAALAKVGK